MLAFQFDIHPTLMTVQVDMRNPENIHKAIVLSFLGNKKVFQITQFANFNEKFQF